MASKTKTGQEQKGTNGATLGFEDPFAESA